MKDIDVNPSLKWPNDVLINDKKICGILTEILENRAIVGIGLNMVSEPIEDSTSIESVTGEEYPSEDLMRSIMRYFYDESINILRSYRLYSSTIEKDVRVDTVSGTVSGTVKNIDENGRLVLKDGTKILSGDVIHLRASDKNP